jgi:hypothetical protein
MARLNFKDTMAEERGFQTWIIEDSWEGTIYLEARVIRTWQGLCGSNKLLEDREGHFYWWAVLFAPGNEGALQRIVTFLDWDSMAAELGITESWGQDVGVGASNSIH